MMMKKMKMKKINCKATLDLHLLLIILHEHTFVYTCILTI